MPNLKVPSESNRASGMLISPVDPICAKEDAQHASTPTQHARKRRIAPLQRCLPSPSQKRGNAGTRLRAQDLRIQEGRLSSESWNSELSCTCKSNKTLPGFPWQGFESTRTETRLVGARCAGTCACCRDSRHHRRNRGYGACCGTRR